MEPQERPAATRGFYPSIKVRPDRRSRLSTKSEMGVKHPAALPNLVVTVHQGYNAPVLPIQRKGSLVV